MRAHRTVIPWRDLAGAVRSHESVPLLVTGKRDAQILRRFQPSEPKNTNGLELPHSRPFRFLCPFILSSWWIRCKGLAGRSAGRGHIEFLSLLMGHRPFFNRVVAGTCVICVV